eukprot:scaffold16648_cov50-Attheya_sp.AAC.2
MKNNLAVVLVSISSVLNTLRSERARSLMLSLRAVVSFWMFVEVLGFLVEGRLLRISGRHKWRETRTPLDEEDFDARSIGTTLDEDFASVDGLLKHNLKLIEMIRVDFSTFLAKANEEVFNGRLKRVVNGRFLLLSRLRAFDSVPVRGVLFSPWLRDMVGVY